MVNGKDFVSSVAEGIPEYDTTILSRIREMDYKEINYYISLGSKPQFGMSKPQCGNCEFDDMDESECEACKKHEYCYFIPKQFKKNNGGER